MWVCLYAGLGGYGRCLLVVGAGTSTGSGTVGTIRSRGVLIFNNKKKYNTPTSLM